eukprot:scaffold1120_cov127-Cylindrotheca_fusiformis.AAC.22
MLWYWMVWAGLQKEEPCPMRSNARSRIVDRAHIEATPPREPWPGPWIGESGVKPYVSVDSPNPGWGVDRVERPLDLAEPMFGSELSL